MTLQELKQKLLVLSNLYYMGEENLILPDEAIEIIAERALSIYNQYRNKELIVRQNIQMGPNKFDTIIDHDGKTRRVFGVKSIHITPPYLNPQPAPFNWKFDRQTHILFSQLAGTFYIVCLVENLLEDIDPIQDKEYIDLALGIFYQFAVEPFKGFQLSELPFENDASELYEQGKELVENTIEKLEETHSNWYLAIE